MGKRNYFTKKHLETAVYGEAKKAPEDMVRPIFEPLEKGMYDEKSIFYEDEKMLVLHAPLCESKKLFDALSHEPCEAEQYLSKLLARDSEPMMVISLDTEYQEIPRIVEVEIDEENEDGPNYSKDVCDDGRRRSILSYQVSCYYKELILRLIFFSKTKKLLSTSNILLVLCNALNVKALRYPIKTKSKTLDVSILAYNALADVSTLSDFPAMANTFAKSVDLLSRESYKVRVVKNNAYCYECSINIVGVQNHVPEGLKKLGESIGLEKIELEKGIITQMARYRIEKFDKFLEYGINDSDICLLWYLLNFRDMHIPISAPALGAKIIEDAIAGDTTGNERKTKILEWRGITTNKVLSTERWYNRASYTRVEEIPVSRLAERIFLEASNAYAGGMNQCMIPGFYQEKTYDYDLCGCYPVAGSLLRDPDYFAECALNLIYQREITMRDVETYDFLTYGFGEVKFEFPKDVTFPCIAQGDGNRGLIFALRSDKYIYATWPEVRTAILMGAKVFANEFRFYESKRDVDGNYIYTLRQAYKLMTVFRGLAKEKYATKTLKKPIQELTWKLASNGSYGKIAQNVKSKKSRDIRYDKTVEMSPSSITSPAHAAYITALPRALLCAVMEQLTRAGYHCYSVTTDGFITNAPMEILEACDGFGLVKLFKEARMYLVNSSKVWETKHSQNYLLNITTRCNQGFDDLDTCIVDKGINVDAHVGYRVKERTEKEKNALPDGALFINDYLRGYENGVEVESLVLPNLNDVVRRKKDYVKTTATYTSKYNFDFKRKPCYGKMDEVYMSFRGEAYPILNYYTEPFESFDEYIRYRDAKEKIKIIRTWKDHWNVKSATYENSFKIPTIDAQVKAAIYHMRLTPDERAVIDHVIKDKSLEYVIAVIKGTVRKSLDAYMEKYSDETWIKGIENYEAKFLTVGNWPNYGKHDRFNQSNYMGYAMWVENAVMYRLREILENLNG